MKIILLLLLSISSFCQIKTGNGITTRNDTLILGGDAFIPNSGIFSANGTGITFDTLQNKSGLTFNAYSTGFGGISSSLFFDMTNCYGLGTGCFYIDGKGQPGNPHTGIEYPEETAIANVSKPGSLTSKKYVDLNQLNLETRFLLPSPIPLGRLIFVFNATGGGVVAYSDGTNWRRVKDGTIIN